MNSTYPQEKYDLIQLSELRLFGKDKLNVEINGRYENFDHFSDGFIILPKKDIYVFNLVTDKDTKGKRQFNINLLNGKNIVSVGKLQKFSVLIKTAANYGKPIILENKAEDESIFLTTDSKDVSANSFNNDEKPVDLTDLNQEDFLTSNKKINLLFPKNENTKDNYYNFNLMKVTKDCSSKQMVKDTISLKTIDKANVRSNSEYKCINLLKADNQLQVVNFDFKTTSFLDTITIKDGLKLTSKTLINSNAKDASACLNSLDGTLSTNRSLLVILTSSFIPDKYEQSTVTVNISSINSFAEDSIGKSISIDLKEGVTTYIFRLKNEYPTLKFDKIINLTTTNLTIYDSLDQTKPVMEFSENEKLNDELWSQTNVLVLKFTSASAKAKFASVTEFKGKKVNCDKLSNYPSNFILNGSEELINNTCNFYFKPKDITHSSVFKLESILLFAKSCISFKSVNGQIKLFEICPSKYEFAKNHLPEIYLPSNDSYLLSYYLEATFKHKILVQASFIYNSKPLVRTINISNDKPIETLTSYNYLSNYPYILADDMDLAVSDSNTSCLFTSFEKYDLRTNDEFRDLPGVKSVFKYTHGQIDDFIVAISNNTNNSLMLSLKTDPKKLNESYFSSDAFGQGFKVDFEQIECHLELDAKTLTLQTPGYPSKFENATKCIAIIDQSDKSKKKYLNLKVESGQEKLDFGILNVYDAPTKQRKNLKHTFDQAVLKNNQTLNFNTSSSKIVLIFDPLDKRIINGFKLTAKVEGLL